MSTAINEIRELLSDQNNFELASKCICATIEAVKGSHKYINTSNIEEVVMEIYDKKSLKYPDIVRRSQALSRLPLLIEPLVQAAMREQIRTAGYLTVPADGSNGNRDIFSDAIIDKYEISAQQTYKEHGKHSAELFIEPRGELQKTFARYGCDKFYFIVRLKSHEEDLYFCIDDDENVENIFQGIFLSMGEFPDVDEIEGLVRHLVSKPNPNLLIDLLRYSDS